MTSDSFQGALASPERKPALASRPGVSRAVLGSLGIVALIAALLLVKQVRRWVTWNPAAVLIGEESQPAYLTRRLGGLQLAIDGMERLPPDSRVLMLWEPRALYCAPRSVADPWIDRWLLERRLLGAPEVIRQAWGQEGVTHVLLFETGRAFVEQLDPRYTPADWGALDELLHSPRRIEAAGEGYALYGPP